MGESCGPVLCTSLLLGTHETPKVENSAKMSCCCISIRVSLSCELFLEEKRACASEPQQIPATPAKRMAAWCHAMKRAGKQRIQRRESGADMAWVDSDQST
eukprot:5397859-Pleurochrysis_carterae.AAC.2